MHKITRYIDLLITWIAMTLIVSWCLITDFVKTAEPFFGSSMIHTTALLQAWKQPSSPYLYGLSDVFTLDHELNTLNSWKDVVRILIHRPLLLAEPAALSLAFAIFIWLNRHRCFVLRTREHVIISLLVSSAWALLQSHEVSNAYLLSFPLSLFTAPMLWAVVLWTWYIIKSQWWIENCDRRIKLLFANHPRKSIAVALSAFVIALVHIFPFWQIRLLCPSQLWISNDRFFSNQEYKSALNNMYKTYRPGTIVLVYAGTQIEMESVEGLPKNRIKIKLADSSMQLFYDDVQIDTKEMVEGLFEGASREIPLKSGGFIQLLPESSRTPSSPDSKKMRLKIVVSQNWKVTGIDRHVRSVATPR